MIMALCAADGHAVEGRADDFHRVGNTGVAGFLVVRHGGAVRCHAQEAGGTQQFVVACTFSRAWGIGVHAFQLCDLVARELLANESVKGFVRIQPGDHVVAELVGMRAFGVFFRVAITIRVTGHIQPHARPPLAVAGGAQQTRDEPVQREVRLRGKVRLKGGDILRCGRQAGQIHTQAADQSGRRSLCGERQTMLAQLGFDEGIDGVRTGRGLGNGRTLDRLKGPPRTLFIGESMLGAELLGFWTCRLRALGDPFLQHLNSSRGKGRFALRHVTTFHQFQQVTLMRLSSDHRRA